MRAGGSRTCAARWQGAAPSPTCCGATAARPDWCCCRTFADAIPSAVFANGMAMPAMLRTFVFLATIFVAALGPAQAQQPSRLDDIVKRGTLRIGMTGDYLPFTYLDKASGKFRGFDVDMAEALGKALGVRIEYVPTAWPRLMKDFEADNFDIAMGGVSITLDRQKKGLFSTPIMREGKTPIARCTDKGKFETIADIDKPGTRVIVNPGGTNERFARANLRNAEVKLHNDNVT